MPGTPLSALLPDLGRRTLLMGVLNATPDSFSDGGRYSDPDAAVEAGLRMLAAGADLVDVGGESTRPGSDPVSLHEELSRVIPVIEGLSALGIEGISVDTTKAEVARQAVAAGAAVVNDISALRFDPEMAATVAELGVALVLSHTRDKPKTMQEGDLSYEGGVVAGVRASLQDSLQIATAAGVRQGQIILDPGLGFGKTLADNLELVRGLEQLGTLGCPLLVGPSRKTFIGELVNKDPEGRDPGTAAVVALLVRYGAQIVRVHDVPMMLDVLKVADAIERGAAPPV